MPRIKINDIPEDAKFSKEDMKRVKGGITYLTQNFTPNKFTISKTSIFREPPVFMERNEVDERIF